MNEEEINELSRIAEEIASSSFETNSEIIDSIFQEAFIRADAPESTTDSSIDTGPSEDTQDDRDFIELNGGSTLVEETTTRFSSAEWFNKMKEQKVIIAGLGGIGSWCSLLLGRCHPAYMYLFDGDVIEPVNMAGQLFSTNDFGREKSSICANLLFNYCRYYQVRAHQRRYTGNEGTENIMICGFDNMKARKTFYGSWKRRVRAISSPQECLYIDGRLNAEEWQIFAIRGTDTYRMEQYEEEWLFNDEEVEEALCSYKQTSFCASMIASYIVNIFVNFVANMCDPIVERDIPFLTEYDAKTMYLKTIQ